MRNSVPYSFVRSADICWADKMAGAIDLENIPTLVEDMARSPDKSEEEVINARRYTKSST